MLDSKLVEQARSADMLAFLEKRCGFTFARRGSVYRCRKHPSLAVKDDRLSWHWHSQGVGGHNYGYQREMVSRWRNVPKCLTIQPKIPPSFIPTSWFCWCDQALLSGFCDGASKKHGNSRKFRSSGRILAAKNFQNFFISVRFRVEIYLHYNYDLSLI